MEIIKTLNDKQLTLKLVGELNTISAPDLEKVIKEDLDNITELVFDFSNLDYLSSAGLRVLLVAQKIMNKQGQMYLHHVNKDVLEIFEMTGFSNILDIR